MLSRGGRCPGGPGGPGGPAVTGALALVLLEKPNCGVELSRGGRWGDRLPPPTRRLQTRRQVEMKRTRRWSMKDVVVMALCLCIHHFQPLAVTLSAATSQAMLPCSTVGSLCTSCPPSHSLFSPSIIFSQFSPE